MNDLDKIYAENIAKEYAPRKTNKVRQLKKLDEKAKMPAFIFAMSFGIIAALVFGTGLSLSLGVMGDGTILTIIGAGVGLVGMAMCFINYPIYKKLLEKGREKYAFEILELAKEITETE